MIENEKKLAPFQVKQLDHIVLRVVDIEAMLAFYIEVLGCTLELTQGDFGLYQLRAGSGLIDLVTVDGKLGRMGGAAPEEEGRNVDHFCLAIDPFDVDVLSRYLRDRGVEPSEVATRYGAEGYGPSIYVRDPEGNVVELKGPPDQAT